MSRCIALIASILLILSVFAQEGIFSAFREGNGNKISRYFSNYIEFGVESERRTSTREAARLQLNDFFTKNRVSEFRVIYRGGKHRKSYILSSMMSNQQEWKVYMLLYEDPSGVTIRQLLFSKSLKK